MLTGRLFGTDLAPHPPHLSLFDAEEVLAKKSTTCHILPPNTITQVLKLVLDACQNNQLPLTEPAKRRTPLAHRPTLKLN